jgi:Domain of unknown function (DUF3291)
VPSNAGSWRHGGPAGVAVAPLGGLVGPWHAGGVASAIGNAVGSAPSVSWLLAQYNEALLRAPLSHPMAGEFVAGIAAINRLADCSPGFVWRASRGHDDRALVSDDDDRLVVNLSLWRSYGDLHGFVYRSAHGGYVRRRGRWFEPRQGPSTVLWWVPAGVRPELDEGRSRVAALRRHGPHPAAFTMTVRYEPDGRRELALHRSARPGRR